jgi:hypothetical protein
MGIPETSPRCRSDYGRPGRVDRGNVRTDENLVLEDQRDLVAAGLDVAREALVDEVQLERVADEEARGDARIGIDTGDADGVIVVPEKACALV